MTELEKEVLDIINKTTNSEYVGKLKVLKDPDGYRLFFYFDRELTPTVFGYEGTEDEFKNFIREEFKTRKMEKAKYYKVIREPLLYDLLDCDKNVEWDDE